jgi:hypothetical protein
MGTHIHEHVTVTEPHQRMAGVEPRELTAEDEHPVVLSELDLLMRLVHSAAAPLILSSFDDEVEQIEILDAGWLK